MTKILVIGLDGATWSVIRPNLDKLPHFKEVITQGKSASLWQEKPLLSANLWTTIFSGLSFKQHQHKHFIKDNHILTREEINVSFIWDVLFPKYDIRALQIPIVIPPYNFNCSYQPVEYGLSTEPEHLEEDVLNLTQKSLSILKENPDVFIVVYNALDRIQHLHWGESLVLKWYQKIDQVLGKLLPFGEKIIILSDHGFCSREETEEPTLPEKNDRGEAIKGDHHPEAILITQNITFPIQRAEDIFKAILEEVKN